MTISIKSKNDDLFKSKAQAWINPVNCVGVMGKGLALAFRHRFPDNLRAYQNACAQGTLRPGELLAVKILSSSEPAGSCRIINILNLATKDHWKDPSKIEWIRQGALRVNAWAESNGVRSVACPALGSGEGQLPWSAVLECLVNAFDKSSVNFEVYEPHHAIHAQLIGKTIVQTIKTDDRDEKDETLHKISASRVVFRKR